MSSSQTSEEYVFLPHDEKLMRLQECDFEIGNQEATDKKKINLKCTLKNIKNPILILFYYNDTKKDTLTQWYEASRSNSYQNGEVEDFIFSEGNKDSDLKFKFASVNLDYEKNLDKAFQKIDNVSPFNWLKTDKDVYYSFVVFYYQKYPQLSYEGILNNFVIQHEFSNWRKDFTDMDSENVKEKLEEISKEIDQRYFQALEDYSTEIKKGILYKITVN